jgi:hypothetical protein
MDNEEQKIMEMLVLSGALEAAGVSESGEMLYNFTSKLKEVMPELYSEHMSFVNAEMMALWEKGFINIDFLSDDPKVKLTELAFDDKEMTRLTDSQRWSLQEIKRLYSQQF